MKWLKLLLIILLACSCGSKDKNRLLSQKWFTYKNKTDSCVYKISFTDSLRIYYFNNNRVIVDTDQYSINRNAVFIISSSSLYSDYWKKKINYSNIFLTKNDTCEMHTLIEKNSQFFVYSITRVINDSTLVGKDVNFYKFKKGFSSVEGYLNFLSEVDTFPFFISYDFQKITYSNCKFKWVDFYTYNNMDTSRAASYNEILKGNSGLLLLDIRKMRTGFPNYGYY